MIFIDSEIRRLANQNASLSVVSVVRFENTELDFAVFSVKH